MLSYKIQNGDNSLEVNVPDDKYGITIKVNYSEIHIEEPMKLLFIIEKMLTIKEQQ